MRFKIKLILAAAALGLVSYAVYGWVERNSDPARIKRLIGELMELVSKPEGEPEGAGMLKLARADKIFAPQTEIRVREIPEKVDRVFTPQEIAGSLAGYRRALRNASVTIRELEITPGPPSDAASAFFTAHLAAAGAAGGDRVSEVREITLKLIKTDNRWRINSVEVHDILER